MASKEDGQANDTMRKHTPAHSDPFRQHHKLNARRISQVAHEFQLSNPMMTGRSRSFQAPVRSDRKHTRCLAALGNPARESSSTARRGADRCTFFVKLLRVLSPLYPKIVPPPPPYGILPAQNQECRLCLSKRKCTASENQTEQTARRSKACPAETSDALEI